MASNMNPPASAKSGNRLKNAHSPYLRQHSENPVHWQPWDKHALDQAVLYDKPILLSIGYSACHWCHVMAHECFEDKDVAALMNENFINIKVDREERPDIDQIYMAALTAMGQQGGWPLTIFLSPQGDAFWGGTYFPKHSNGRMPGFKDILTSLSALWEQDRNRITGNITALKTHLQTQLAPQLNAVENDEAYFLSYAETIAHGIDTNLGGMTGAPKFPNFPLMQALWISGQITGNGQHKSLVTFSTERMLNGGIYDHIGGGLARYSTDHFWLVPHFEKMLYDNAQLIRLCLWAYSHNQNLLFRQRIEEIIDWLCHEMLLRDGGFAAGLDADSDGVEGKFYIWSQAEIEQILDEQAGAFINAYNISIEGNWEGRNIPHRLDMASFDPVRDQQLQMQRSILLQHRNQRIKPHRDDKCLTDWNAYLIRALAESARLFRRSDWLEFALKAYQHILPQTDQQLCHIVTPTDHGETINVPALSTDYAALINAALSLYQTDPQPHYLQQARALLDQLNENHRDQDGDYRLTALHSDDVIFYLYGDQDEAIPSATSQIIEASMRLALITDDQKLLASTDQLAKRALGRCKQAIYGQAGILTAAVQLLDPVKLVLIITGPDDPLYHAASSFADPSRTDVILSHQQALQQPQWASLIQIQPNRSCAILCRNNVCLPPVYDPHDLEKLLRGI